MFVWFVALVVICLFSVCLLLMDLCAICWVLGWVFVCLVALFGVFTLWFLLLFGLGVLVLFLLILPC